jgi:hypothetical protein
MKGIKNLGTGVRHPLGVQTPGLYQYLEEDIDRM